jgi:GDP/UDP-N,N'-diacetylbacillosamine 2-epimerase (hydrolysing)
MKKKILAITGIRSEYDIIKQVIKELKKKNSVKVIVSGAHLTKIHNFSERSILEDQIKIDYKIRSLNNFNNISSRSKAVSTLIDRLNKIVKKEKPSFLLVVGDREEAIAMSIVANYNNILLCHIGGGDLAYGNSDDPIRFATSKLAHVHFVFSSINKANLIKFGEEKFRIYNVGNPSIDNIKNIKKIHIDKISDFLKVRILKNKYIIFIQHPMSSEKEENVKNYLISLNAIRIFCKKYNFKVICISPNSDPGSKDMINLISKYKNQDWLIFRKNIKTDIFVNLIRNCYCIAGNSSMGILETPFYKKFAINIGTRQGGRLNAGNVIYVSNNILSITNGLEKLLTKKYDNKISDVYKAINPSKKISQIISRINISNKKWYIKKKLCP